MTTKLCTMLGSNSDDPNSRYTRIKELGEGSFGHVWLVRSIYSFRTYVKKEMNERCKDENERDTALNEANILARLKHKNIIRYKDAYFDDGRLCIIMEYADDGDLYTKIKKQSGRMFDSNQILNWFVQLVMAVKYIHDQNILHRDLKSQNIFLTMMGILKVGDFGISRLLECTSDHAKTVVGTPYYLSPEICRRELYNKKSDMWSVGVILYEMTTLTYPFIGKTLSELIANILVGNYASIESHTSPLICDLVLILLQLDASSRPSAADILRIPAVATIAKNFMNKIAGERNKTAQKEFSSSPLIERKRDKSFKYDVIFDLTCDHDLDNPSSGNCKNSVVYSDLCNATDVDRCNPRHVVGDAKRDLPISSPMQVKTPNMPAATSNQPLVSDITSVFADIENKEELAVGRIRKMFGISRKRTFTLDRDAVDAAKVIKWRRSCDALERQRQVQDVTSSISFDCQESSILDERACNGVTTFEEAENPRGVTYDDRSKSPCCVESVGPLTDFSSLLFRVAEGESSKSVIDRSIFESNQQVADNISKEGKRAVEGTFNVHELSPKIKAKVLGRARKFNSRNVDTKKIMEKKEIEKCSDGKKDSSKNQEQESLPSQSHVDLSRDARIVTKASYDKEYSDEFSKTCRNPTEIVKQDYNVASVTKDVLVFVDDEEFLPLKDQRKATFVPKTSYYDKVSVHQFAGQLGNKCVRMENDQERMEKLNLILESRIGENRLKVVCNFLRQRKLALLEDDVLAYLHQLLGEEVNKILPMMIELLMIEKRLSQ